MKSNEWILKRWKSRLFFYLPVAVFVDQQHLKHTVTEVDNNRITCPQIRGIAALQSATAPPCYTEGSKAVQFHHSRSDCHTFIRMFTPYGQQAVPTEPLQHLNLERYYLWLYSKKYDSIFYGLNFAKMSCCKTTADGWTLEAGRIWCCCWPKANLQY